MSPRLAAFLVHLGVSFLIGLLVLILVFVFWYPTPLHQAVGVTHISLILLGVDVTLGPLLTFLVFKVGKKTLVFDLVCIVLLQMSALVYGLVTVADGRPAWLVFNVDRFDVVRVLDIDSRNVDKALPEYRSAPWFGPKWVGAQFPDDVEQRNQILMDSLEIGSDLPHRPDLYHPLSQMTEAVLKRSKPLAELDRFNPPEAVEEILARWPSAKTWVPLMASAKPMTVLLGDNAEIVAVVDLHPWGK